MAYILTKDKVEIADSKIWNSQLFGDLLNTSFPKEISQDYVWENEGYWLGWITDPEPILPTKEELLAQEVEAARQTRAEAYRFESDPLFFKWQRGEVEKQAWLDKVAEIKAR
jgi:hypothetical protein